ncbi:MAG: hypothetical protein WD768_01175 [Phycisphaeraceae bacterium]
MLLVVSIIVLLISILLPMLGQSRENARKLLCMSNQRIWSVAVTGYCVSNQKYFPDNRTLPAATGQSFYGAGYIEGRHISWNSSVVRKMWKDYLEETSARTKTDDHDALNCPTQKWHQVNDISLVGGLVGYFYMPGRSPDGTTNYAFGGNDWVFKKRMGGKFSHTPILSDMKQYSLSWNSWFYPPGAGTAGSTGGPISSHIRGDGEPEGGYFLFEAGHVTWYKSDKTNNPAFSDPDDIINLGCTIGTWQCYYRIPL